MLEHCIDGMVTSVLLPMRIEHNRSPRIVRITGTIGTFRLKGDLCSSRAMSGRLSGLNEAFLVGRTNARPAHPSVPPLLHRLAIVAQELGDLIAKRTY
jgi:hypothetical protein